MSENIKMDNRLNQDLANLIKLDPFNRTLSLINPDKNAKVLDIGCGPKANTALAYSEKGCKIIAIDVDPEIIEAAKKNILKKHIEFKLLPVSETLPFDHSSIDVVTCRAALHHMPDKTAFFKEVKRIIKNGGWLHIADPIVSEELQTVWTILSRLSESDHYSYCTYQELQDLFVHNDFEIISMIPFQFKRNVDDWINLKIIEKDVNGSDVTSSYGLYARKTIKELMLDFIPERMRNELHFEKDSDGNWWFKYNCFEIAAQKRSF